MGGKGNALPNRMLVSQLHNVQKTAQFLCLLPFQRLLGEGYHQEGKHEHGDEDQQGKDCRQLDGKGELVVHFRYRSFMM